MSGEAPGYHHGDLPATLVRTAIAMLDADGGAELSIRAVAREAGVSSAAPYRHFPDRPALMSAVAAAGFGELMAALVDEHAEPAGREDFADLAVVYVRFATARPGLFRVMFGEGGQRGSTVRDTATAAVHEYLDDGVRRWLGLGEPGPTTTGLWALVHGLASLYVHENLRPAGPEEMEARVRRTVAAMLAVGDR